MKSLLIVFLCLGLIACDKKSSTDGTKQRAEAEQEGANRAENDNLAKKAIQMEEELTRRHFFYSSLEGEYQGSLQFSGETYLVKFSFAKSLPPYTGSRVRQLSEIEKDINNLHFFIQVVQWHPADESTAVGCRVSEIRPNMDEGTLTIASPDCPNLYNIMLSDGSKTKSQKGRAKSVAQRVKDLSLRSVPYIVGKVQPSSNANRFSFSAKKLK
jgi:hypothetical protein